MTKVPAEVSSMWIQFNNCQSPVVEEILNLKDIPVFTLVKVPQ